MSFCVLGRPSQIHCLYEDGHALWALTDWISRLCETVNYRQRLAASLYIVHPSHHISPSPPCSSTSIYICFTHKAIVWSYKKQSVGKHIGSVFHPCTICSSWLAPFLDLKICSLLCGSYYIKAVNKDILNWVSGIPSVVRVAFPTLSQCFLHFNVFLNPLCHRSSIFSQMHHL